MEWFGKNFGPICDAAPEIPTPVGEPCGWCAEPIAAGDNGVTVPHISDAPTRSVPYHIACNMRMVIGGLNHLRGACQCCGGTEPPDPPWLTLRDAARAAVAEYRASMDRPRVLR